MLFSDVKRSPLLWLHKKSHLNFAAKKYFTEMVWHFIGVYVINRKLHGRLEIQNFSSCVEIKISLPVLIQNFSSCHLRVLKNISRMSAAKE